MDNHDNKSNTILQNSNFNNLQNIVSSYYINKNDKFINIDNYQIIIDDIRNFRKLNDKQLEYIKNIDNDKKYNLFLELNKLFDIIEELTN
jgi:hypothetical protein